MPALNRYCCLTLMLLPVALIAGVAAAAPAPAAPLDAVLADLPDPAPLGADTQQRIANLRSAARQLIDDGEFETAIARLETALGLTTADDAQSLYLLAIAQAGLGRAGQARALAEYAAQLDPESADTQFFLGVLEEARGRPARAVRRFERAVAAAPREPNNPRITAAWYRLGKMLAELGYAQAAADAYGRFDEAIHVSHTEHRDAAEVEPILAEHPDGLLDERLRLLRAAGRRAAVVEAAAEALEQRPDDVAVAQRYIRALLEADDADAALRFCFNRLRDGDGFATFLPLAADAARAAGELDAWITRLADDLDDAQQLAQARALAALLHEQGDAAAAARLWGAVLEQDPTATGVAWRVAVSRRSAGDLRAAVDGLIEFLRRNSSPAAVPLDRVIEWVDAPLAAEDLATLLATYPSADRDAETSLVLALTAVRLAPDEAAACYAAAHRDGGLPEPRLTLGWARALIATYQWQAVLETLAPLQDGDPPRAAVFELIGRAHAGLDEVDAAEAALKQAVEFDEAPDSALLLLADLFARQGNLQSAQLYAQRALTVDPTNGPALERAIELYLAGGKADVARSVYEQAQLDELDADVRRRITTSLRFAGRTFSEEHVRALSDQHDAHPDDIETALQYAQALLFTRELEPALGLLRGIVARDPRNDEALESLAQAEARLYHLDAARQHWKTLHERYPRRRNVIQSRALAALHDFDFAAGRALLKSLPKTDLSDNEWERHWALLLTSYRIVRDVKPALELLDAALTDESLTAERREFLTRERVRTLSAAEQHDDAVAAAEQLLAAAPDEFETRALYVSVLGAAERFAALEERLQAWRQVEPADYQWLESLVEVLIAQDRGADALDVVEDYQATSFVDRLRAIGLRARCLAAAERVDAVVALAERMLDEDVISEVPQRANEWQRVAVSALVQDGQYDRALDLIARWKSSTSAAFRNNLLRLEAFVYQAQNRLEPYAEVMQALLEQDPHDPGLNNDLGYMWVDAGLHVERATGMIRLALGGRPLEAAYLDSLGWAYYKQGDWTRAREYLARATQLIDGSDPVVYDHLGDVEYRLGKPDVADQWWQKALELLAESELGMIVDLERLSRDIEAKRAALAANKEPPVAPTAAAED